MENNHYGVESSIAGRNQFFYESVCLDVWRTSNFCFSCLPIQYSSSAFIVHSQFHGHDSWIRNVGYLYCAINTCICNASKL